jgi:rubrerythrin
VTYRELLHRAYQGELIGEILYRTLATRTNDAKLREKMLLISDVEQRTNQLLHPLADGLRIEASQSTISQVVRDRTAELQSLSWDAFLEKAAFDWPPFIEQFEALRDAGPRAARATLQLAVDHEVALVEFIRLERSGAPNAVALEPLRNFLKSTWQSPA